MPDENLAWHGLCVARGMKNYKILILAAVGSLLIASPGLSLSAQTNQGGSNLNSMSPGNPNRPGNPGRPFSAVPDPATTPPRPVHIDTGTPNAVTPGNGVPTGTATATTPAKSQ